jgi:hypothetical protein
MPSPLSIWLAPAPELSRVLGAHIERIAAALGSPPFAPHVTVLGDLRARPDDVRAATAAAAHRTASLELQPQTIATSSERFEALTVRFGTSAPAFERLSEALATRLGATPREAAHAHLSLAYPRPPFRPEELRPLAAGVPRSEPYRFTALVLVDPGPGRQDWNDVSAWRVIETLALAGAG